MLKINYANNRGYNGKTTQSKRKSPLASYGAGTPVQNRGGLLGGLGYLGGSLLAGIGGVGEGIADLFTAAGAAIGGDFEYAKYVFKDNNVGEWHESITESYNPGNVMKFFGDVTHGIGQSSVFLLNAIPGLGQLGTAAFFAGTASQGISSAAAKTGDVGFGEVAYGVLSGGVEAGLEAAFGGMGKVAKNIGSPLLKNIGITATRKGLVKSILTDAASEFGEEFASELIDPLLLNWTQVDPNARMSLGDAVYAGFVGLVSGAVSAGVSDVAKFAGNRKNGAKIMQSGNADTLINTANYVADKLIGQGADFKKAPEWAQHLRMQVNAYNDLVKKGKATGATAETILGEIQASLYFAETQSTHERIKAGIMAKSEADRAALAEYVNQTVEKSKRKKDYTAADVAADTDGIASQLATMSFVRGGFDIDGAIKDLQREGGIEDVINSERAEAAKRAEAEKKKEQGAETDAAFEAAVARGENNVPNNVPAQGAVDGGVPIAGETAFVQNDEAVAPNRAAPVENIYEEGAESLPYSGVPEARVGTYPSIEELDVEGREIKYDLTEDGREVLPDSGKPEPPGSAYPSVQKQELENMTVTEADRAAARERTERAANFEREQSETYNRGSVSESREKATEGKNEARGTEEIKINEPKEALTDEQRAERADKAAKAKAQEWVEWDKKTAPTMRELNRARELVKEFDELEIPRRLAILRTIRSAEGVDAVTLKGVVNIMSVLPKSDLEIRFAEKIGQYGLYTTVGGKKLIVLNSDTNFKATIKGTIAHELVHYLEKRAGYKQFAEFVRKRAKPEAIERHKQIYIDGWADIGYKYTEAELDEEITASLVADALQSEKFLKRYADRDKKLIQRAASWFGGLIKGLKRKGKETREERKIAEAYGTWMSALLQMPEVGESRSGVKYDLDEKLGEQLKEWLDNGGKKGTKYNGVYFDLGTTPNVFIKHGAKKVKMIMYDDVVAKVTGMKGDTAHTISIDEIAKLPSQLNDPILLFKGSVPGSFVALTELTDKYGNDVVVAVHINRKNERSTITKIASLYSKTNEYGKNKIESFVNKQIESNNLIDASAKKAPTWFTTRGLQLPKVVQTIIDANNSIPQKNDLSTPSVKKYDLADGDAAFERAVGQMYKKEAQEANKRATEAVDKAARAEKTAKAFAAQAARSTEKYKLVKGENKRLKTSNLQLAKLLAREAKQEEAKTYTQKEHSELIARMQTYASDKFSAIADSKDATISKYDKERFAEDLYIALSLASNDPNYRERVHAIAGQFSKRFLEGIYFPEEGGKRVYLKELIDDDTYKRYAKTFENKLIKSFEKMGKQTSYAAIISRYNAEMERFKQKLLDSEQKGKKFRELIYQAQKLRTEISIQKRNPQDEGIIAVEREMGKITNERGQMSAKQADAAFALFNQFLLGEGEKVEGALTSFAHDEGAEILDMLQEYLHSRKGRIGKPLTAREMDLAATIIAGGRKLLREYNKVFVNGHWVDIDKFAGDTVGDLLDLIEGKKEYSNKVSEWLGGKLKGFNQWYFYNILSPETVIESLEGYKKNGALKTLYRSIRDARQTADHRAVQMKKPFAEYLDDKENAWEDEKGHKHSYRSKLNKKIINVNGYEITLGEAIYLYMLTKREEAHAGLRESGYITYDENNQEKKRFKILEIEETANFIYNQFDKADIKFLEMAEQFFNKTSTKVKTDADMEIFGYTNTIDSYYVPMIRDRYSRMQGVTDARQGIESIITVYNKSFNQNVVYNAKALEGKNIMEIINDHADGLAEYAEMYLPLKAFDRVYNRAVVLEDGSKTTIRSILNNKVWQKSEKYFKKLFEDIQGQGRKSNSEMLDPLVGKLRSGWVNAVLGANIKVVLTQTSSLGAATQVIEPKYIMRALSVMIPMKNVSEIGERADKYSKIIEARSFDMGALKAQGNIDKINDIGRKTGIFIEKTDRRVCLAIFHAAELRVEETMGLAVGTEENAIEAAKIADEAIYTTQAMSSASERSALQRSTSEIAKVFAMFTSDTVKNLSHLYGNTMKYFAHRERVKAGDVSYEAELKKDAREIRKSVRTLAITGVMIGAITQLFKYLYAKEEEEPEDRAWDAVGDVVSSTLNIFPIISDVVDKWVMGYDLSLNVFDLANDTLDSVKTSFNLAGKVMSGQYVSNEDVAKAARNLVNSVATVFSFPAAPIERTVTGLMRRFTPSTIYGYDALFSNPSYTADLKKAVESGDERLAEHILATLYNNEITGVYSSEELEEIARLYSITDEEGKHLSVLPQRIGDTVNDVKLDAKQRKRFAAIYSEASAEVNRLIDSPYYDALDDAQKAKAIKNTYSLYYNRAASEVVGKEWTNAQAYSLLTANIPALFASQAYKSGLEVQKDERGKEISVKDQFVEYAANLGLSETDLTVISYANSVRGKDMKEKLIEHINSMSLDEETKAKIAERLGFVIKSGKVAEKED